MVTNDLADAVRSLGDELAYQDSATFRLVLEGPVRELHPIPRDETYSIIREALHNAFSHARAQQMKPKSPMTRGCFGFVFGTMEPAFLRHTWKKANPAITVCAECASAPPKSEPS